MKSYSKGILVGMSIVLGSLLLMGLTESSEEVGRYQLSFGEYYYNYGNGNNYEKGIFKIDTKTGVVSQYYYGDGTNPQWIPR